MRSFPRSLGSLTAAFTLLMVLAAALAVGTIMESYFNRQYAYHVVYGSLWFYALLVFLAVNVLFAALLRLPFKKLLTGFYLSHLGLLLILGGSLLTMLWGIDGSIMLTPHHLNNRVSVEKELQLFANIAETKSLEVSLPNSAFQQDLNQTVESPNSHETYFTLKRFIPYAQEKMVFAPTPGIKASGIRFELRAPRATTDGILSSPPADYPEGSTLGALHMFHLGHLPAACILPKQIPRAPWLYIDEQSCRLLTKLPSKGLPISDNTLLREVRLLSDRTVFQFESPQLHELLIPDVSAWPLMSSMKPRFVSDHRIYLTSQIFSGKTVVSSVRNGAWEFAVYDSPHDVKIYHFPIATNAFPPLTLPWMGLELQIREGNAGALPRQNYESALPQPGEEQHVSALAIESKGAIYWATNRGENVVFPVQEKGWGSAYIAPRTISLPWTFELTRFKMDKDPGTNNPASFESFVTVYTPGEHRQEDVHIFMNNPLKKGKYTFYQASYFPIGQGDYGSVLQVNYDPGRAAKYMGSFLVVFGTALHFYMRRKR